MCRLLGVVCDETTEFRFSLHEAERSLSVLSADHPDGWGLAVHRRDVGWDLHKYAVAAHECTRFREVAAAARGEILVAHIRKRTVGPIGPNNTHPFRRDGWVFAHNGTIEDQAFFADRTSDRRMAEVEGDTDSERYFAAILTAIDPVRDDRQAIDAALVELVRDALDRPRLGAANFLLSDGHALYAFRLGRTLQLLERRPGDDVTKVRHSEETDADLATPWSPRRHAVLVASEKLSAEPWREIAEGTLLRIALDDSAKPRPRIRVLHSAAPVDPARPR